MSDTPETDEQINGKPCTQFAIYAGDSLRDALVPSEFARKLERERNEIAALVRRLFQLLETVEVSDSEREFHPTRIQSCRVMHTVELGELLPKLKEAAK